MHRIHIIGGPGSGKTHLAHRLNSLTHAPVFQLDSIGYEGGAGPRRPLTDKLGDVHRIAEQPKWISEGIFLWWTDALLREADLIVWLDPPWRVACWRILFRHISQSVKQTNKHKGLHLIWEFLKDSRQYYIGPNVEPTAPDDDGAITKTATLIVMNSFGPKVVRVTTARKLNVWLETFTNERNAAE